MMVYSVKGYTNIMEKKDTEGTRFSRQKVINVFYKGCLGTSLSM